eukprot:NODE_1198_length_583_cov_55.323970_g1124_i0.p5 GENE.NODE_1198_length_583_cov_55.323970_g1124_i0~~NODE_1198_length_583_cov_55.323970_g1124_i0.p5  ORF type:complete len:51 (-),score=1.90 NODE_1198_length_583_cov_55.323970_g1124_i0:337-489(-)
MQCDASMHVYKNRGVHICMLHAHCTIYTFFGITRPHGMSWCLCTVFLCVE